VYIDILTDQDISRKLTIMTPGHPLFDRLVDLVKGDLSTEQQGEITMHVATCSECAAEVAWLEHILKLYHTDDSTSAPPAALAHVRNFLRRRGVSQGARQVRRITAVLIFDSANPPQAIPMRSNMAVKRQFVFRAEELDLDLHVTSAGSRWIISGQVLGSDEEGRAELWGEMGMLVANTPLNDLRQFTLPAVNAGTYMLKVQLNDTMIEILGLEIGT
jgi:hypothetical protein